MPLPSWKVSLINEMTFSHLVGPWFFIFVGLAELSEIFKLCKSLESTEQVF